MQSTEKAVVVTGGAAGIGRAMAEAFLTQGARVAICDADPVALAAFQDEYPDTIAEIADVSSENDMARFLDRVEQAWGGADVVCANAGTGGPARDRSNIWTMKTGSAASRQTCMAVF